MNLESAVERLYSDESLSADVDDATAAPLLRWAEEQLPGMIERAGDDDDAFEESFVTLRKLVKSVARLIDQRGEMGADELAERVESIHGFAQELGVVVNTDEMTTLAAQSGPDIVAQMLKDVDTDSPALPEISENESFSAPESELPSDQPKSWFGRFIDKLRTPSDPDTKE